jgi:hypothetical protein
VLQDIEGGQVDIIEFVFGEDLKAQAAVWFLADG